MEIHIIGLGIDAESTPLNDYVAGNNNFAATASSPWIKNSVDKTFLAYLSTCNPNPVFPGPAAMLLNFGG